MEVYNDETCIAHLNQVMLSFGSFTILSLSLSLLSFTPCCFTNYFDIVQLGEGGINK